MSRSARGTAPFSRGTVLALVLFGFATFLALLYFISAGDTGRGSNDGGAHAASNGLNGFSGLAQLLESRGYNVAISRSPSNFDTDGLLVLTPPIGLEAEEFEDILEKRYYSGPTLVILPKWYAQRLTDDLTDDVEIEDGWVRLLASSSPHWSGELEYPYKVEIEQPWKEQANEEREARSVGNSEADRPTSPGPGWNGFALSGKLPDTRYSAAKPSSRHYPLVRAEGGDILALEVTDEEDSDFFDHANLVVVVVEPDLMNNYGLADQTRAELAMQIIEYVNSGEFTDITFDVTLNGLGGATNLLTLAFRPPFLAATICLLLAMLVVGWRAFIRFGPPRAEAPAIAFGKSRLVTNGAGLILRARRLRLLAEPYIALTLRRIGKRLGIARADSEQVEAALTRRLPEDTGFAARAEALRTARGPRDILRAARALKELERKLER